MEPADLAARLAGGAALAFFDLLLYGAALFLITRLWVIAAPRFGRRCARGAILFGLPAVALATFAYQWLLAPPDAEPVALGRTALVLDASLLPIWLLALAVRGIARLLGRPPRASRPERWWEPFAVAGVTLPIAVLLCVWQAVEARDEVLAAKVQSERLRRKVSALQTIERRPDEFERETQMLAAKLAVVKTILPPSLGVPEFMAFYRATAKAIGVDIGDYHALEDASGPVHRAEIATPLLGSSEAVEALLVRTRRLRRLVDWRPQSTAGSWTVVVLTVYAVPDREPTASAPCELPGTEIWLWPYASRVEAARGEWAGLCVTLRQLRATPARVGEFEAAKGHLEILLDEIVRLRPGQDWDGRDVP